MKYLSVCIPTYEMAGHGQEYLLQSFDMLSRQTFSDFEVIISDHSTDDSVKSVCHKYSDRFELVYLRNPSNIGSSSANINNAIRHSTGSLIKILFQDDFLFDKHSLAIIIKNFDLNKDRWLATGCEHSRDGIHFDRPYQPTFTEDPHLGNNLIGSPSVITIKNDHPLLFDEKLIWLMDGDYYKRCTNAFGPPKLINDITVVNRLGAHQITNTIANESLRRKELDYITTKFNITKQLVTGKSGFFNRLLHRS